MFENTKEAVISNESLISDLESELDSVAPEARIILEEAISRIKNIGKNESLVSDLELKLDSVTPKARNIIKDAINSIKNIGKYDHEFFKRGVTLTIEPTPELVVNKANIYQSFEKVIEREKVYMNNVNVCLYDEIWNWGYPQTMKAIEEQFNATIHRFTQKVTHAKVREKADKLSVKKDWDFAEAWNIIIAGILAGEVDTKKTGIFVYFTVKMQSGDVLWRLCAFRTMEFLCIRVRNERQVGGWISGHGVVFDN